jgi:hypothetical protein
MNGITALWIGVVVWKPRMRIASISEDSSPSFSK